MYFGGFYSSTNRLNDVHIFDTVSMSWVQPLDAQSEFTPRGNHMPTKDAWPSTPTPRGGHSANIIGDEMYVFGGYGGQGYSRRDFNDRFVLELENDFKWRKAQTRGKAPEPRSGHSASTVDGNIYIYGGWSSSTQFSDLYIYQPGVSTWSVAASSDPPLWNHGCVAVEAIPNWKMFVFGGCRGELGSKTPQGEYSNDVLVLDTGSMSWNFPEVSGTRPKPRSDTEMVYDAKGSRLIFFGGWASRWFGDLHTLDVGSVVGPPYAIMGIEPRIGPITGNQQIDIEGIDFVPTDQVTIRFVSKKGAVDVGGEIHLQDAHSLPLPRLQRGRRWHGRRQGCPQRRFLHYDVPKIHILCRHRCFEVPMLWAGPARGRRRQSRNRLRHPGSGLCLQVSGHGRGRVRRHCRVHGERRKDPYGTDRHGGWKVHDHVRHPDEDEYEVSVVFKGTYGGKAGHLRGSPYKIKMEEGASRDKNTMTGPLVLEAIRKEIADLTKFTRATENGLKAKVPENSLQALVKAKEHLHNATARKEEIDLAFDRSRAVIEYLAGEGANMGRLLDSLNNSAAAWQDLQKQVPITRSTIAPLVKVQGAKTKVEIASYEESIAQYQEDFKKLEFWQWAAGPDGARRLIDEAEDRHNAKQKETDAKQHLANMFEFPTLMQGSQTMMAEVQKQLEWVRDMWDAFDSFLTYQEECSNSLWSLADADAMEEETNR